MIWIAAKVDFTAESPALAEDLISCIFHGFELQGVIVAETSVTGYFPKDDRLANRCRKLAFALAALKQKIDFDYRIDYSETDEEDWAESWKAFFKPERVGKRMVIKPTWEMYDAKPDDVILEIDPGMAFGTGTHPTTSLCIELIETRLNTGDSFLDIGTGSGILMVAAAKLGADKLVGIDRDPTATAIAAENLRQNRISRKRYQVMIGHLARAIAGRFDVVTANILTEVILVLLENLKNVVTDNGVVILSGITEANLERVHEKMEEKGFRILETRIRDIWAAIVGTPE